MTTYPGMKLGGEIRESVSLDEDDLSDVEDEVFIRDGKHGYKFAEDVGVKRPLMAPRRKLGRPTITTRLKTRPSCKALCKPCCYIFIATTVLIGLISLVVVVSIFPLPLDKLKDWIVQKTNVNSDPTLLPCSDIKVTDVWTVNIPKFITESPIRTVDVNQDGVEDAIFGYGTGNEESILQSDIFCPIFMGVLPPCRGGIIALNGVNGETLWKYWTNDTIFNLICTVDVDGDGISDCLINGESGTIGVVNSKTGKRIWENYEDNSYIYMSNFIGDQDNDTIPDILTSYSPIKGKIGYILLISGQTGKVLKKTEIGKTFFMPQVIKNNEETVIFGTGTPNSPGNLTTISLKNLMKGNMTSKTIYLDQHKGMLTQALLVDINGDNITDIILSMFNSTVTAIDGSNFKQIWNFTIPNHETSIPASPAYFTEDNVTDFLVIYGQQNGDTSGMSKTYIIDGKTGKSVYQNFIPGSINNQIGTLSLQLEGYGSDMFLYWTNNNYCTSISDTDIKDSDLNTCNEGNSTNTIKLNILNRFSEPPGFEVYNSENRKPLEYNNTRAPLDELVEFLQSHPDKLRTFITSDKFKETSVPFKGSKYKGSNFRHKDGKNGLLRDFSRHDARNKFGVEENQQKIDQDYDQQPDINSMLGESSELDYNYLDDANSYNQKLNFLNREKLNARDPRSKYDILENSTENDEMNTEPPENKYENVESESNNNNPKYGIYNYKNIHVSRKRLLHDLSALPTEILKETYFKNRESELQKSRFEERDINEHKDKAKENEEVRKVIEEEKRASLNTSENLWSLESEKEEQDRENGYFRAKRDANFTTNGITQITSVGTLVKSMTSDKNVMDIIFITYWLPEPTKTIVTLSQQLEKCMQVKIGSDTPDAPRASQKIRPEEKTALLMKECERDFPYFNQVSQLNLGQMTVYRLQLECVCEPMGMGERCAKILPIENQNWGSYLGKLGDGFFKTKNL